MKHAGPHVRDPKWEKPHSRGEGQLSTLATKNSFPHPHAHAQSQKDVNAKQLSQMDSKAKPSPIKKKNRAV